MALGQIDFSPLRRAGAVGMEVARSYDPVGSFTKGALKGIELGQSFQKMRMANEEMEMKKEDQQRRGTLLDLQTERAKQDIERGRMEIEDLPAKRDHERKTQELKLSEAETNLERQRVLLDQAKVNAKKAADEMRLLPTMTARSYEEAGGLADKLHKAIAAAPDDESKRLLVDRANNIIGSHPVLSKLYPEPISADDNGMELLRFNADLFNEQAKMMTSNSTFIDEATGNLMGFDKDGNPKLVKTKDQLDKVVYRPTAVPISDKAVKDNRRAIGATLDKLQQSSGIDYDIPDLSDREIQERVTSQYLGILKERQRLNAPEAPMEELVDEAFDLAFPANRFTIVEDGDRKKATYNPQAPVTTGMLMHAGKSEPVEIMGQDPKTGNYIVRQPGTGKQKMLTQAQYDAWFRERN